MAVTNRKYYNFLVRIWSLEKLTLKWELIEMMVEMWIFEMNICCPAADVPYILSTHLKIRSLQLKQNNCFFLPEFRGAYQMEGYLAASQIFGTFVRRNFVPKYLLRWCGIYIPKFLMLEFCGIFYFQDYYQDFLKKEW